MGGKMSDLLLVKSNVSIREHLSENNGRINGFVLRFYYALLNVGYVQISDVADDMINRTLPLLPERMIENTLENPRGLDAHLASVLEDFCMSGRFPSSVAAYAARGTLQQRAGYQ